MNSPTNTLIIEAGIAGGSLALFSNGCQVDSWTGEKTTSKAEDVLQQISVMLSTNKIIKADRIIVSTDPGSATGLRIGRATALGLAKAWRCSLQTVDLFRSIREEYLEYKTTLFAVPAGNKQVAWKLFKKNEYGSISTENTQLSLIDDFLKLDLKNIDKLFIHQNLVASVAKEINERNRTTIEIIPRTIASVIGRMKLKMD